MEHLQIPNSGWIVVGDGRKALFLRNDGTVKTPSLSVDRSFDAPANPKTSVQGSERPGRVVNSIDGRRSGVEQTDFHDEQEAAFARQVADEIGRLCGDARTKWIALVGAPRTLAVWRQHLSERTKPVIKAEIPKDLTRHSVADSPGRWRADRHAYLSVSARPLHPFIAKLAVALLHRRPCDPTGDFLDSVRLPRAVRSHAALKALR